MESTRLTLGRPQACMGSFLSWQPLKGISFPVSSVHPLSSAHQVHAVQPFLCLHNPSMHSGKTGGSRPAWAHS